jgi:hypothetical protein
VRQNGLTDRQKPGQNLDKNLKYSTKKPGNLTKTSENPEEVVSFKHNLREP